MTLKYSVKNSDETMLSTNARRLELVTNALDQMADALRLREPRLVDVVRTELMNLHFHSIAQKSDAIIPTNRKRSLLHPLNAKLLHDGLSNMSGAVAQLSLTANARCRNIIVMAFECVKSLLTLTATESYEEPESSGRTDRTASELRNYIQSLDTLAQDLQLSLASQHESLTQQACVVIATEVASILKIFAPSD